MEKPGTDRKARQTRSEMPSPSGTQALSISRQRQKQLEAEDRAIPTHCLELTGVNGLELTRISEKEGSVMLWRKP